MPKLLGDALPKYRLHKPTGRAVVTLSGKEYPLGPHGTKASKLEYDRLITEWINGGRRPLDGARTTVVELLDAFTEFAISHFPEGSTEITLYDQIIRLLEPYWPRSAADFGPLKLDAVRSRMVDRGWCRTHVNRMVNRLRRIWRWGVSKELVPAETYQALRSLEALQPGRTPARETEDVPPVEVDRVRQTIPHLSPVVRDMVAIQLLCGARPGEVCDMRTRDIDRRNDVWEYRPQKYKTQYKGDKRVVYLGPQAQAVMAAYLDDSKPDDYLFEPRESVSWHREQKRQKRKTPAGQGNEPGTNARRRPKRTAGSKYTTCSYRRAITRACELAFGMPKEYAIRDMREPLAKRKERWAKRSAWQRDNGWAPNQLRHTCATDLRDQYGLDVAQAVLGHKSISTTQIYADRLRRKAVTAMLQVG